MDLLLHVDAAADEEEGDQATWSAVLREELGDLDEADISDLDDPGPDGAKGIGPGALLARIPHGAVGKLIGIVRAFAVRTSRSVEVTLDGDTIKISGASREQQDRVIEAWLARHSAGS